MKIFILLISSFVILNTTFSQANFQWEKIDSIGKSKSQIYSDTKMFIAEYWKSAQNVIQNDDKENGMILVKGSYSTSCIYLLNPHNFIFSYTVKFYMKENKFRIQIDNVTMTSHTCAGNIWAIIPPVDNYSGNVNLSASRGNEIFNELKAELQKIYDSYLQYIRKSTNSNSDW